MSSLTLTVLPLLCSPSELSQTCGCSFVASSESSEFASVAGSLLIVSGGHWLGFSPPGVTCSGMSLSFWFVRATCFPI